MEKHYHILNGDALKEQFPEALSGERIVASECLVDGDVQGDTLEAFFETRAKFISDFYGDYSREDYYRDSATEFEKIQGIPTGSSVYLWFEDDLFCQVNAWFVSHLLLHFVPDSTVFLIRPQVHTPYGFGGLSASELEQAFADRVRISDLAPFARLWEAYRVQDLETLKETARSLEAEFPFIPTAVEAHIARIPTDTHPGRPTQALLEIMQELQTEEFGPVFRAFHQRESIYGFGDLQVKRLFDALKK
ncbi:MAG: DUF1835 domain-containing protein [Leptolyngbya sp. SIO3F4]|nr:DUF1835 domain-containing protein [Leptolyngbya sp. SIO3F4]